MAYRRQVRIESAGPDKYGRTLGRVYVGSTDANLEMIRAGMAWVYPGTKDKALTEVEVEARTARRGLWADKAPVPPWEWRNARRE